MHLLFNFVILCFALSFAWLLSIALFQIAALILCTISDAFCMLMRSFGGAQ